MLGLQNVGGEAEEITARLTVPEGVRILGGAEREIPFLGMDDFDMATWRVVKAKEISRREGWPEFIGIQNWFSYLRPRYGADMWVQKFVDDELLDYCQTEQDLTILPYTSTLGGLYAWDSIYDRNHPALNNRFFSEDNERRLSAIQGIAKARNVTPFRVMFAWMLSRKLSIIPILGVSKVSQLEDNLGALDLALTDAEIERLDQAAFNGKTYKEPEEIKLIESSIDSSNKGSEL